MKTMSLRKGSYRRPRYSAPTTDININSENSESIVMKGDGEPIDRSIEELDTILTDLRKNANVNIKDLNGTLQQRYRQAVAYVSMLYDTDYYPALSEVVSRKFGDIETFQPGTVGAYFGGCLVQRPIRGVSPGCTPTCAGSAPPSDEHAARTGWSPCEQNVVLATMIDGRYNFSRLNTIDDRKDAILYIDQPTFTGFTAGEKRKLSQLGIDEVLILSYQDNQYKELLQLTHVGRIPDRVTRDAIPVIPQDRALQDRAPAAPVLHQNGTVVTGTRVVDGVDRTPWAGTPGSVTPGITSNNTMWIILLAILALIILFLVWRNWDTIVIV